MWNCQQVKYLVVICSKTLSVASILFDTFEYCIERNPGSTINRSVLLYKDFMLKLGAFHNSYCKIFYLKTFFVYSTLLYEV